MSSRREFHWKVTGWKAALIWYAILCVLASPVFALGFIAGRLS